MLVSRLRFLLWLRVPFVVIVMVLDRGFGAITYRESESVSKVESLSPRMGKTSPTCSIFGHLTQTTRRAEPPKERQKIWMQTQSFLESLAISCSMTMHVICCDLAAFVFARSELLSVMSDCARKTAARAEEAATTTTDPSETKAKRTLRRNNTAAMVQRNLASSMILQTWKDMVCESKDSPQGSASRRTKNDLRHNTASQIMMGKKFYDERRTDYNQNIATTSEFQVKNQHSTPDETLLRAVKVARQTAPQRGQLYAWLASSQQQKKSVGAVSFWSLGCRMHI